jgi:hypothetical protein
LYVGETICYTNNFFWQQDFQTAEVEKSAENKGLLVDHGFKCQSGEN